MECILTTKDRAEAEAKVREAPDRRNVATYADGTVRVFEFKTFRKVKAIKLELEEL